MNLVTAIVATHLNENQAYLTACLESLLASEYRPLEVICVADTKEPPVVPAGVGLYHKPELNTASAKVNWAVKTQVHPDTKYLWLVSDDVIVANHTLKALVDGMGDQMLICNPMSNCDNTTQFLSQEMSIPIKLTLEELGDRIKAVHRYRPISMNVMVPVRSFVSFYCTLIPKKLWDAVGPLDERLDFRGNDVDYCMRAAKHGAMPVIQMGAFALHFGDITLPKCTTKADLDRCSQVLQEKWAQI